MPTRRQFLVMLLAGCIGVWLLLEGLIRLDREGPNYSLIEEWLFMGGDVAKPPPGTRAVLNLCEKDDPYRSDVYLWESIPDAEPVPSIDWLRRVVEWIDAHRRAGRTIFVHCRNGASRSGMVIVAYVMFKNHWTRDQALAFVRSKRPVTRPNPAFMQQLIEWERELEMNRAEYRGAGHAPLP